MMIYSSFFPVLDSVSCLKRSHLLMLSVQLIIAGITANSMDEMMDMSCNEKCPLITNCSCDQTDNDQLNIRQNDHTKSKFKVSNNMTNLIECNATMDVKSCNQSNVRLNFSSAKTYGTTQDASNINQLKAAFGANNIEQHDTTLKVNNIEQPNATLKVNNIEQPNATLKVNNIEQPNATLKVNNIEQSNATFGVNKISDHMTTLKVNKLNQIYRTTNVNTTEKNIKFKTKTKNTSNQSQNKDENIQSIFDNDQGMALRDERQSIRVSKKSNDSGFSLDCGHLSIDLNPEVVDLQCFGCNGEFLLEVDENAFQNNKCSMCFKTMFSFTPSVFKLVKVTEDSMAAWTTSLCKVRVYRCQKCNEYNWFENRPDGVCRRLYIYDVAMSVDDISICHDDLDIFSTFIISSLKYSFGFDILDEWWPPLIAMDERLNTRLYVTRILVYDVHHASIKDAAAQIRQLSLITYMLRYHLQSRLNVGRAPRSTAYSRVISFDLGDKMRRVLDYYNITKVTNRSTCVCKAVYGALAKSGLLYELMNTACNLGCFYESFDKFERSMYENFRFYFLKLTNSSERIIFKHFLVVTFIIHTFLLI